ncbi:MAG: ATP-dependent DNA helicase RecG [Oscillospiraceae bacterium]|nr:ATP-dependent DNA helicase RecG [Oscillospiraceae bacterium]
MTVDSPLTDLRGVGDARAAQFAKRGVLTVGDLLALYPRAYENRGKIIPLRDCTDGELHAVEVVCTRKPAVGRTRSGLDYFHMYAQDDSAPITVTFFNRRFLLPEILPGRRYRLYGRITMGLYGAEALSPEIEPITPGKPLPAIVPIYPLSGGLTQKTVRNAVLACLPLCDGLEEELPEELRRRYGLLPRGEAIRRLHQPRSMEETEQAKRTVAFAELLTFQLALRSMRRAKDGVLAPPLPPVAGGHSFLESLPFALTNAQAQAIREIFADLERDTPMTRLVQGDVGSGKTVVAAAALERCATNGHQAVLLAPTEILAEQHAQKIGKWFEPRGIRTALLTSSVPKKQKEAIKKGVKDGEIHVLIGTHAVLQGDVSFASLGLVVTDEQHRFGVRQRALLLEKSEQTGPRPHMLVLSATPIPRSLSLILYGDLDVTLLRELPPGRQPIETMVLLPKDRERIYASIRRQLAQGGQAYIICPLVEENAELENASPKKAAESYFAELQTGAFAGIPMGLIHGKLPPARKAEAMEAFAAGETRILVSTTVIEVGVDVPNANVMLIENAECFGLSQLHQLRGRIGRGTRKSFCVLLNGSGDVCERLDTLRDSSDGFAIAEADLKQRGPGDFFGDRQSGEMTLHAASLTDLPLIAETSGALEEILPHLKEPAYHALSAAALRVVRRAGNGKTIN